MQGGRRLEAGRREFGGSVVRGADGVGRALGDVGGGVSRRVN